ncbi:MAG: hypothetical protein Q7R30_01245 [Acidobacteriota bacterium]|nr:hypothetical protein [Acidobacteriota bacterium]
MLPFDRTTANAVISGPTFLFQGTSADYRFVLEVDRAPLQVEKAAWRVTDSTVALIDVRGHLRAINSGLTTVQATFQGLERSQPIRIVPDLAGDWEGPGQVTTCGGMTCDFRRCFNFLTAESRRFVRLTIAQDKTELSGTIVNGVPLSGLTGISIPVTGRVGDSGSFALTGETPTGPTSTLGITRSLIRSTGATLVGAFSWRVVRLNPLQVGTCREDFTVDVEFSGLTRVGR